MENFIDDVRSIDFENLVSVENVDEAYSNFQSAFTEVIDKTPQTNTFRSPNFISLSPNMYSPVMTNNYLCLI
jgi:hypothetical protein